MLIPPTARRRSRLTLAAVAATAAFLVAPSPAGESVTFFLEAIVVGQKPPAQTDGFTLQLRFLNASAARLSAFGLINVPGQWSVSKPEVLTANFKSGFHAALQQVTGNPAKVKWWNFPELVVLGTEIQGSITARYKYTDNGIKKKVNFAGFVAGNQVQ